jgi:glucan phosphoethanolaminetransferase (alkaline phosphatase superfamily)
MPEGIGNQIGHIFNSMGFAIFQTIIIYFVVPFLVIVLISRFVFRIRGKGLQFILSIAALGCLYFFSIYGLPEMQNIYSSLMK